MTTYLHGEGTLQVDGVSYRVMYTISKKDESYHPDKYSGAIEVLEEEPPLLWDVESGILTLEDGRTIHPVWGVRSEPNGPSRRIEFDQVAEGLKGPSA